MKSPTKIAKNTRISTRTFEVIAITDISCAKFTLGVKKTKDYWFDYGNVWDFVLEKFLTCQIEGNQLNYCDIQEVEAKNAI